MKQLLDLEEGELFIHQGSLYAVICVHTRIDGTVDSVECHKFAFTTDKGQMRALKSPYTEKFAPHSVVVNL